MSAYKYKSIILGATGYLGESSQKKLNEEYNNGWEFVDSVAQMPATGTSGYTKFGPVVFTLKRLLTEEDLLK